MRHGQVGEAALALLKPDATLRRAPAAGRARIASAAQASTATTTSRRRPAPCDAAPVLWDGRRSYYTANDQKSIAIVGGGLTGLSTAYYLAKSLPVTNKITLYESADRLGGWVRTDHAKVDVGGTKGTVAFERGPRTLSSLSGDKWRYDDLVLWSLAADLGLDVKFPPPQPRYIYYPDHLVPTPPYRSPLDYLIHLIKEPLFYQTVWEVYTVMRNRRNLQLSSRSREVEIHDISVGNWLRQISGGDSLADNLASGLLHGIYGGDVDHLSAETTFDRFWYLYHFPTLSDGRLPMYEKEAALIKSMGTDPVVRSYASTPKGSLVHFGTHTMEALTTGLWDALKGQKNVEIRLKEPVQGIVSESAKEKVKITSRNPRRQDQIYDKVIFTLSGEKLQEVVSPKLEGLEEMFSVSIMMVNIWYPQENIKPPGFGYLIPRSVDRDYLNPERALGVFYDSDVGVAGPDEPKGTKLCVMLGGHYYLTEAPIPSEGQAIDQAKALLERHLGIPRDTPCYATANLNKDCIPQPGVNHRARMSHLNEQLGRHFDGRLAVAGGAFQRVGGLAALRSGYEAANSIAQGNWSDIGVDAPGEKLKIVRLRRDQVPVRSFEK